MLAIRPSLRTLETEFGHALGRLREVGMQDGQEATIALVPKEFGGWAHRTDTPRTPPAAVHPTPLPAVVNHGRWIVECDQCAGAQIASRNDRRFICSDCLSGGSWYRVEWPVDVEAIEAVLMRRPDERTRNWRPGETVADLIAENAAHGVI